MTSDETVDLPADAQIWLDRQLSEGQTPWSKHGIEFLAAGATPRLLDTSYLTESDLANPDVAANVKAIADTAAAITWVAEDEDGKVYGYWNGPQRAPSHSAALVEHDSEGQFYLTGAHSITELLISWADEIWENGEELTEQARAAGITDEFRDIYDWERPEVEPDPRDYLTQRYHFHRNAAL